MASKIPGLIDWPFAVGEGPFHVKGVSYRGHQKFIDEHVPGAYAGILDQLDPTLQKFYAQPFLASCWYDLAPLVAVAPVCAAACGLSTEGYLHHRAQIQVDQDISGVYAYLIKLVAVATAYLERVLEIAGAKHFVITPGPFVREGEAQGIETVGFELEVAFLG